MQQPTLLQGTASSEGYALSDSHHSHVHATSGEPPQSSWYSGSHVYASYPDPTSEYAPQQYQYGYQQQDLSAHGCSQQGYTPAHTEGGVSAGNEPELDNESVSPLLIYKFTALRLQVLCWLSYN